MHRNIDSDFRRPRHTRGRPVCPGRARGLLAGACLTLIMLGLGLPAVVSAGNDPEITLRRQYERRSFTDAEILDGFFKITFGAEFRSEGRVDRIRKYDGPVRIYIDSRASPDRRAEVATVIEDIRTRIEHLDIALASNRSDANVVVALVRDRDLPGTIKSVYGNERARRIQRSLSPQCLSGFAKDDTFRIVRSEVILVVDAGDFVFFDCAYEELLQALGPINDDASVPWTMFNDDVSMGFFDLYDQYLLNILYDPRIRPGMTRAQVATALPSILPTVRANVARTNNLD